MSDSVHKTTDGTSGDCHHCYCIKKNTEVDNYSGCQNHLKNWEAWNEKRKKVNEKLTKSLGRPHEELLINASEDYRSVREDKLVFEYTNINTNFDKLRGNPEFWKLPLGLIDRCDKSRDPIYFTTKTKEEKNEIPVIEYVGTPNYILDEKNVLPRTRNIYQLWKDCKYRNEQLQKLSLQITQIEPHKPQHQNLVLVGHKVPSHKPKAVPSSFVPQSAKKIITISPTVEFRPIPKICFKINETTLTKGDDLINDTFKIRLIFESYRNENLPVVQYLKLENRGLTTLRLYWRKIEKFTLFRDLIKRERAQYHSFYFDKSELLLPPGRYTEFPVWFKAKDVGNYFETWEITTVPSFWGDDFHLIISLQGFVFIKNFDKLLDGIKTKLDENVRNTLISDLLRNICNTFKYTTSPQISWSFNEEQLFESANQEIWGVEKRCKYLYDETVVKELKRFYNQVKQPNNPTNWNYSVRELKIMTRKKDVLDYVEEKTREATKGRERRLELQSILKEQIEMSIAQKPPPAAKTKPAPVPEKNPEDAFQIKQTRYNKLEDILRQLERPLMIKNKDREKYFTAFAIMRTYMFKMCDALDSTYNRGSFIEESYYPSFNYQRVKSLDQIPGRLLFENFDDIWVERIKRVPPDGKVDFPVLPKPEILNDIPLEDTKTRYKRYFNLPDTPPEVKGKGKGKPDKGKDKKDKASETKGEAKGKGKGKVPERVKTVIDGFNPYSEEYITPITDTSSQNLQSSSQDYTTKNNYDYEKYLIVYSHLYEAIGAMVDALETFKETIIPVDMLGGLTKCTNFSIKGEIDSYESLHEEMMPESVREKEDELYFQYLLDSHLNKNLNSRKYLIHGKTKPDEDVSSNAESQEPESLVNLFRSQITLVEEEVPDGSESVILQTSVDEEYKTFSDLLLLQEEPMPEMESTENDSIDESYTREIFYYLGGGIEYNEELEERESDEQ